MRHTLLDIQMGFHRIETSPTVIRVQIQRSNRIVGSQRDRQLQLCVPSVRELSYRAPINPREVGNFYLAKREPQLGR